MSLLKSPSITFYLPIWCAKLSRPVWMLAMQRLFKIIEVEIGLIKSPLGMSPFVVKASIDRQGLGAGITLNDVYAGSMPFALAALAVVLIVAFPQLALWPV